MKQIMNVTFFILAAKNGCFAFVIKIAEGWKENEEIANNEKGQRPMTEIEMWIMLGSFFRADNGRRVERSSRFICRLEIVFARAICQWKNILFCSIFRLNEHETSDETEQKSTKSN